MTSAIEPDSARSLRAFARRVANGESVVPTELACVLETIGPSADDFVVGRALRSLSGRREFHGDADRRRVFHAARALAERLGERGLAQAVAPLAKARPREQPTAKQPAAAVLGVGPA